MRIPLFPCVLCLTFAFPSSSLTQSREPAAPSSGTSTNSTTCVARDHLTSDDFAAVLKAIQEGWSEGDARKSANCFTEDAIYSSPPSREHQGRENLYKLFGGAKGPAVPMKIVWHHFLFDPVQQLGMAEYTFQYHLQTHGVVVLKFSHGLISNWREYDIASDLSWDKFVGANNF